MNTRQSILLLAVCLGAVGCKSPYYADQLAGIGAVTGALTGAAIGNAQGDAATGALIGTAVGALGGAAIGDAVDQDLAASQAAIEAQLGRRLEGAVRLDDVVALAHANLGDNVIITHIQGQGVYQQPSVSDLIFLRQNGVSDPVIQAYQQAPLAGSLPEEKLVAPARPVVIEEHYHTPVWHPAYRHPHHPRHRRARNHWHFSLGL